MKDILKQFEEYLLNEAKISIKSLKFYRSDINRFKSWMIFRIRSLGVYAENLDQVTPFIKYSHFKDYVNYLKDNNIPIKTINRRLSTLRQFSRFLVSNQIASEDFTNGEPNVRLHEQEVVDTSIADKFAQFLEANEVSHNTSKSYISDIKQFLYWFNSNHNLKPSN